MAFFTDLATNASKAGVSIVLYSGNDDSLVAHRGTEGEWCRPNMPTLHRLMYYSERSGYSKYDVRRYPRVHAETFHSLVR